MTKTLSWPQEPREMRDWRVQAEIKPAKRHKVFKFSLRLWGGGWEKECRRKGHVSHTVVGLMHVEPLGNKLCLLFTKLVCWSRSHPRRKHWPCFWMCVDRHENSSMGTIAAGWKHHVRISRLLLTGHSLFSICVYLWPSWFYIYCKKLLYILIIRKFSENQTHDLGVTSTAPALLVELQYLVFIVFASVSLLNCSSESLCPPLIQQSTAWLKHLLWVIGLICFSPFTHSLFSSFPHLCHSSCSSAYHSYPSPFCFVTWLKTCEMLPDAHVYPQTDRWSVVKCICFARFIFIYSTAFHITAPYSVIL